MPDNTAKIIIDASADGVLRAAEQVKKKFSELGEEGGKAGGQIFEHLGKSFLRAAALTAVIKGVAEALNTAASNAAKLNKEVGGRELGAEISGQRLGLKSFQTKSILAASGPKSESERAGFLDQLANAKGPGGRPLDSATALEASRIFGEGTTDSGEIIEALTKRGRAGLAPLAKASRSRLAGLSDEARAERDTRIAEVSSQQRASDTSGAAGVDERKRIAKEEALRAENPGAFAVGDAIGDATEHLGGKAVIEAGRRAADGEGFGSTLLGLAAHPVTKLLQIIASNGRTRLNTSANGPGGE